MDSQTHRDSINSQLSTMSGQVKAEGSFEYTEGDMTRIRDNWLNLADSYRDSIDNAGRMARIEPPAEDMASSFHARAASASGDSYLNYLKHNRQYCQQQAQHVHDAIADYLGIEHTNVMELNRTGQQGPQDGV